MAAAASQVSEPTTAVESTISGKIDIGNPEAAMISDDHTPLRWSKAFVAEASDLSVARTPVRRWTTKSLATQKWRTRAKISGSWSRTHITFSMEYVGLSRWPRSAYAVAGATTRSSAAVCSVLRVSAQMIAGRTGWYSYSG